METEQLSERCNELHERDPWNKSLINTAVETELTGDADWSPELWTPPTGLTRAPDTKDSLRAEICVEHPRDQTNKPSHDLTSVAEFIERRFIPEYVALKRSSGRSYFRSILNHVLPPELVAHAFAVIPGKINNKLKAIPGWPYMDSLRLCELNTDIIQNLTATAVKHGYSIQTATHIRNVIRVMFSHAIRTGCYTGTNPASIATLPAMTRKEAHTLSLQELTAVMQAMRYPEKEIVLLVIFTQMSVAEVRGLQWKYVNMSHIGRLVEDEFIPPKTIAVRKQSFRSEFGIVTGRRRRYIRVPDLLCSLLSDLKTRKQFTAPDDFILVSRHGTPIHPENVAARRLKVVGRSLKMPWLSWRVFHRTGIELRSQLGRKFYEEFAKTLVLQKSTIRQ